MLVTGQNLSIYDAEELMSQIMDGKLEETSMAAYLTAMRMKGESEDEIAAFAGVMRNKAVHLEDIPRPITDIVGTGGDSAHTINISTLSSLVLASMGHAVAKHGNYSVSSKSGSADIFERLGYKLQETPEEASRRLRDHNFAFLFAPSYHPAMKYVGPVRKKLGIRTFFNILGPLCNPALADIILLGVYEKPLMKKMFRALEYMKLPVFLVVHSRDHLDEISPVAPTDALFHVYGNTMEITIHPELFPMSIGNLSEITVTDPDDAYRKALSVMDGSFLKGVQVVSLNASYAMALNVAYTRKTMNEETLHRTALDNYPVILDHLLKGSVSQFIKKMV